MKRSPAYFALVLAAALATGGLVGCGQNAPTEPSAPKASAAAAEQTKDEVIAELEKAAATNPEFNSITVNETTTWTYDGGETSEPKTRTAQGVYKFDESVYQLNESIEIEYLGEKARYFTDGTDAVLDFDGTVISGTTEQFKTQEYSGFDTFVSHVIGEMETLVACADTAAITKSDGLTNYVLTLDADKLAAMTEELTALKEEGIPVKDATLALFFDEDENVRSMELSLGFDGYGIAERLEFSDINNTEVDPEPEATMAYEEAEKELQVQIDELFKELDAYVSTPSDQSSSDTTSAK